MCSVTLYYADQRPSTGKLRCDHAVPCGRCVRRQTAHQCSYELTVENATWTPHRRKPTAVSPMTKRHSHASTSHLVGDESFRAAVSAQSNQVGFMGSSSYLAVFDQMNGSLDLREPEKAMDSSVSTAPVPEDLVRKGAYVLFHLRDLEMLDSLLQRWLSIGDGYVIFGPIYRIWMREITEYLGPVLGQATSPDELLSMSLVLWQNTRMPIEMNGATTVRDWARRTAGQHLRWEVVGLLFSAIGIVSGSLSNRDTTFVSREGTIKDRPTLVRLMLDLVDHCVDFCKVYSSHNDLYACLLVSSR